MNMDIKECFKNIVLLVFLTVSASYCACSPDGFKILAICGDHTLRLYDSVNIVDF
jgi:hypothetical protein